MDADGFVRELPQLFDDFPRSEHPRDRRFAPILEQVGGLARENNLALINLAASMLDAGESYVEVGSFKGLSLIAAMLGNEGEFVGIDNFSMADASREQLERNLAERGLAATILEGDAFDVLPRLDRRVGVLYYDATHGQEGRGIELAEPDFAPGALILVDDTDWERVERSLDEYLQRQPRARRLLTIVGKDRGQPWWWEGVQVLVWDRP